MLSLELQRGLVGLGEAQDSGGSINAAHATPSLKSQRDKTNFPPASSNLDLESD